MSTFADTRKCPRCGGQLEHSEGNIPMDNYEYCLDCGYSYRTIIEQWSLGELNIEREELELPKLEEYAEVTWSKDCEDIFQREKTER